MSVVASDIPTLRRTFAIRLLHEAQISSDTPFVALVAAAEEPDRMLKLETPSALGQAIEVLNAGGRRPWALYLHRPGQPTAPTPDDFAGHPQLLRLTSSLATKGVLQLRAWVLEDHRVVERVLRLAD